MKLTIETSDDLVPDLLRHLLQLLAAVKDGEVPMVSTPAPAPENAAAGDPTKRELPWPAEFPEPPPLPEGKTRWVYRGTFDRMAFRVTKRRAVFCKSNTNEWFRIFSFSADFPHIEAI